MPWLPSPVAMANVGDWNRVADKREREVVTFSLYLERRADWT